MGVCVFAVWNQGIGGIRLELDSFSEKMLMDNYDLLLERIGDIVPPPIPDVPEGLDWVAGPDSVSDWDFVWEFLYKPRILRRVAIRNAQPRRYVRRKREKVPDKLGVGGLVYVRPKFFADETGVPAVTVRSWCRDENVRRFKRGDARYMCLDDLQEKEKKWCEWHERRRRARERKKPERDPVPEGMVLAAGLSEQMGLDRRRIGNWVYKGKIPGQLVNRRLYVRREDVEEYAKVKKGRGRPRNEAILDK